MCLSMKVYKQLKCTIMYNFSSILLMLYCPQNPINTVFIGLSLIVDLNVYNSLVSSATCRHSLAMSKFVWLAKTEVSDKMGPWWQA
jgi:hypothetical protein